MRKFWTEEENQTIRNGIANGLNYKQITELLPDRAYRSVAVQGNKLLGALVKVDPWTIENELELIELRDARLNIKEIALILGRDYMKVKAKISQLIKKGLIDAVGPQSSPTGSYSHQNHYPKSTDEELLEYVKTYIVCDTCPRPFRSRIKIRFGSWTKALELAGLSPNIGGKLDFNKDTVLYLLDFGKFKKVGITQQSIKARFSGAPEYTILDSIILGLEDALYFESAIKCSTVTHIPEQKWFERNGKTECFISDKNCFEDLL